MCQFTITFNANNNQNYRNAELILLLLFRMWFLYLFARVCIKRYERHSFYYEYTHFYVVIVVVMIAVSYWRNTTVYSLEIVVLSLCFNHIKCQTCSLFNRIQLLGISKPSAKKIWSCVCVKKRGREREGDGLQQQQLTIMFLPESTRGKNRQCKNIHIIITCINVYKNTRSRNTCVAYTDR